MSAAKYRQGLSDAALAAAASPGLLRRAERDVAAGLARLRCHSEHGAEVEVEGMTVTLTSAGIKAARCTCPSREICRHVLAAALVVRAMAEPDRDSAPVVVPDLAAEIAAIAEAELERAFGRKALREGAKLLAAAESTDIRMEGPLCRIRLASQAEVIYLAGGGIAGMLSKAPAARAKALHAAALLAVRGTRLDKPEAEAAPPDPQFLSQVRRALLDAAQSALGPAPRALEDRLLDLAVSSRADRLPALSAVLRQAAGGVAARRARDPLFNPLEALATLAHAFALTEALGSQAGDAVRGALRQRFEESIETEELVGCGVEVWRAGSGAQGATAHLYDPRRDRWFSASLARAAGQDPAFSPESAARFGGGVWGHNLVDVGSSRVALSAAKASAAGRLSLSRETVATLRPCRLTHDEIEAWPAVFRDWDRLHGALSGWFSPSLRPRERAGMPAILWPSALGPVSFDDAAQLLVLPVRDIRGRWLGLTVEHNETRPQGGRAVEALAAENLESGRLLFVIVTGAGRRFQLKPYAASARDLQEISSFFLESEKPQKPKPAKPDPPRAAWASSWSATDRLLETILDEMVGFCELGGRMHDPERAKRLSGLARLAEDLGLEPLARVMTRLQTSDTEMRRVSIFRVVYIARSLAALRRPLPLLANP